MPHALRPEDRLHGMAAEVAAEQAGPDALGEVGSRDHRELEVAFDGAPVDALLLHHRDGGQQVLHVPRRPQREHVGLLESEQQLLELV